LQQVTGHVFFSSPVLFGTSVTGHEKTRIGNIPCGFSRKVNLVCDVQARERQR
jgi:hypothetical protein